MKKKHVRKVIDCDRTVNTELSEIDKGEEIAGRLLDALRAAELSRAIVGFNVSRKARRWLASHVVDPLEEALDRLGVRR